MVVAISGQRFVQISVLAVVMLQSGHVRGFSMGYNHKFVLSETSMSAANQPRRDIVKYVIAGGTALFLGQCGPALAQRPPPRPNIKSMPQECLQAGTCAIAGADAGLPQFRTAEQSPEILDPKGGRYSTGLKIQEISVGDPNGTAITEGKLVSIQFNTDTYDFKFGKGQVVPGFEQAIAGMRPGGRRRFILPPELGYTAGIDEGKPGPIPPGWGERRALDSHRKEPLVFEVQVVKVK